MSDNMTTRAASGRQRNLAAFFASTFLGLALFFLIVGASRQHSAMLAASGSLAICGLALLLVVRLRKMEAREEELADTEDDESGEDFVDDLDYDTESDTGEGDEAPAENDSMADSRNPGQLPEPRPRNEDRLFEHKTDDLRDSVNYR